MDQKKDRTIKITASRHKKLKIQAEREGMTLTKYIEKEFKTLDQFKINANYIKRKKNI